jgi:hypothetical protein
MIGGALAMSSSSDSDFPSAVGFGLEDPEEESGLTENEMREKRRFQEAMLAQKIKRQSASKPMRPIEAPAPMKKKGRKGEYFSIPLESEE